MEPQLGFVVTSGIAAPAARVRPAARPGRRRWRRGDHVRVVVGDDGDGARVVDRVRFAPTLAAGGWIEWTLRRTMVVARHAWLAWRFGARRLDFALETPRLRVRPWTAADRLVLRRLSSDPVVMRFINGGRPWREAEVDAFLSRQAGTLHAYGYCLGAIVERAGGEPIGLGGLQPLGTTADVEIGWCLTPSRWGQGLATEVGIAALRFAFATAGLERVTAIAHPDNVASRRVMERLGMRPLGLVTGRALGLGDPDVTVVHYLADAASHAGGTGV